MQGEIDPGTCQDLRDAEPIVRHAIREAYGKSREALRLIKAEYAKIADLSEQRMQLQMGYITGAVTAAGPPLLRLGGGVSRVSIPTQTALIDKWIEESGRHIAKLEHEKEFQRGLGRYWTGRLSEGGRMMSELNCNI